MSSTYTFFVGRWWEIIPQFLRSRVDYSLNEYSSFQFLYYSLACWHYMYVHLILTHSFKGWYPFNIHTHTTHTFTVHIHISYLYMYIQIYMYIYIWCKLPTFIEFAWVIFNRSLNINTCNHNLYIHIYYIVL